MQKVSRERNGTAHRSLTIRGDVSIFANLVLEKTTDAVASQVHSHLA